MDDTFIDGDSLTTYQNLANAIVLKAVEDYRFALRHHNARTIRDCEDFFRSEWFMFLCDINGEHLIKTIQKEINNNENNKTKF
jgi:IS1 family transposase